MIRETGVRRVATLVAVFFLCVCFLCIDNASGAESAPMPEMPANWKVKSDFQVPAGRVKEMSGKLGADLDSVRNTVYDVDGKRVQINVIVASDSVNAERLMMKLSQMKSDEALLRKGLIVYEFVGRNDVLPVIEEGRKHLELK